MRNEAKCPNCGAPAKLGKDNKWRPFCSERCRLIDLGAWIDGSRSIPSEEGTFIEESEDIPQFKH